MTGSRRRHRRKIGSTAEISLCYTQLRCPWSSCIAKNKIILQCAERTFRKRIIGGVKQLYRQQMAASGGGVRWWNCWGGSMRSVPHKYEADEVKHTRLNVTGHHNALLPAVKIDELEAGATTRNA
ncbi:hypothetical protein TcG_11519 [Trypanosoma cruzi]|nr:hypothetical protein TcG_11519 [Trypanosoma cruzi]